MRRDVLCSSNQVVCCCDDTEEPAVKLVDGKLAVEYGDEFGDPKKRTLSHLIYDRNFPEKGFVITTEEVKTPSGY